MMNDNDLMDNYINDSSEHTNISFDIVNNAKEFDDSMYDVNKPRREVIRLKILK